MRFQLNPCKTLDLMFQRTMVYLFFYLTFQGMQDTSRSSCIAGVEKFWQAKRCDQSMGETVEMGGLRHEFTALKHCKEQQLHCKLNAHFSSGNVLPLSCTHCSNFTI